MTRSLQQEKSKAPLTFLLILGLGIMLFLPFVIYDKGYFIYYGDFNAQQIPFYQLAHDAVRNGEFFWNWGTDLGVNFIGSYSFYLLGSPFFWLTIPFPTDWLPYMMAPLLVLKMAFAGLAAYGYTRRFLRPQLAMMAGILYAFSGFSLYNIFFNHFHEALIWFPLLLLGVEQYMTDGRKGLFAFAVMMTALSNYYFFIGQAIFIMIYWIIRCLSGEWEHTGRRFFGLWLEALLGTAAAAVLLVPSFFAVVQNSRTESLLEGWGLLIYRTDQRLYDILHSFIFPPELPARANFLPDADNKWSSMTTWIPVFGCTGAIAYFQSRKHTDWLRKLIIILFFFALIPGLNAIFQLFNQMYYARWFYMFTLMLILATLSCFEQETVPVNWGRAIAWTAGGIGFFALFIGLMPSSWSTDKNGGKWEIGLERYPDRFWIYVGIAILCLILTGWLVRMSRKDAEQFFFTGTVVCCVVSLTFGMYYITAGKTNSNYPDDYVIQKLIEGDDFSLDENGRFYRTDMNKGMDNQAMYWNQSSIQAFHSIVPGSVMDFYKSVGISRSVASRPDSSHYALRPLLSVRWLFDYAQKKGDVQLYSKPSSSFFRVDGETAMPEWSYYGTQNGYYIYENDCFIPMGFTYDSYITREEYDSLTTAERELVLLKAIVVDSEETAGLPENHLSLEEAALDGTDYQEDCIARALSAADEFSIDRKGFQATIDLPEDNLVFFSVPYEDGWTATVNGKPADVVKVNVGFMAVACPAGECDIRFDYETPGLRYGILISAGALLLLIIYWLICLFRNRRKPAPAKEPLPAPAVPAEETVQLPSVKAEPAEDEFDLYQIYKPHAPADEPADDHRKD